MNDDGDGVVTGTPSTPTATASPRKVLTPPGASSPAAPQRTEYGYDDDSRLVGVRYPEGTVALYQLDSVGNRVGERKAPSSAVTALTAGTQHVTNRRCGEHMDWTSVRVNRLQTSRGRDRGQRDGRQFQEVPMKGKRILDGERPSALFREELRKHPNLANADLARLLMAEFPHLEWTLAMSAIWNWRRPDGLRPNGIDDDELDSLLRDLLRRSDLPK